MARVPKIVVPPVVEEDDSPQIVELKQHMIEDASELAYAIKKSEGFLIRLGIHDRDSATMRIMVRGENAYRTISFQLVTVDDFCQLKPVASWKTLRLEVRHHYAWKLLMHHAAEAIFGVRELHRARRRKAQKARKIREAAKADA